MTKHSIGQQNRSDSLFEISDIRDSSSSLPSLEEGEMQDLIGEKFRYYLGEVLEEFQKENGVVEPSEIYLKLKLDAKYRMDEAHSMGLTEEQIAQREQVRQSVLGIGISGGPEAFEQARVRLEAWGSDHPDDPRLPTLKHQLEVKARTFKLIQEKQGGR